MTEDDKGKHKMQTIRCLWGDKCSRNEKKYCKVREHCPYSGNNNILSI